MNKSKIILLVASILFGGMNTCDVVSANNANNEIDSYNLDNFIVEGEVQNNYNDKYIRTGGDVNFITSQDIKKYHYSSLTDAIKKYREWKFNLLDIKQWNTDTVVIKIQ